MQGGAITNCEYSDIWNIAGVFLVCNVQDRWLNIDYDLELQ
jgi:hypothetical protein